MANDGSQTPGMVETEDDRERYELNHLTADAGSASGIVHVTLEDGERYGVVAPAGSKPRMKSLRPLPRIPSINVTTKALLCDRSLPAERPQEGDGGSSQLSKRQSNDGCGVPHQGQAVAHCYKVGEGHDSGTITLGDEARSQGSSKESSRLWRQDKFLAEFGGMAYKPVADAGAAGSSESSLSSCLRALSGIASNLSAHQLPSSAVDQQVTSYLAAVLEWAGALEAKMETAYSSDRSEEEKKVKALEIVEDILKKVQELYATSGKHAQEPVRVLVVPCGWMEDTVKDVERAVTLLLLVVVTVKGRSEEGKTVCRAEGREKAREVERRRAGERRTVMRERGQEERGRGLRKQGGRGSKTWRERNPGGEKSIFILFAGEQPSRRCISNGNRQQHTTDGIITFICATANQKHAFSEYVRGTEAAHPVRSCL